MTHSSHYQLFVLGSFRLECDGAPLHLSTRKNESLLAYLALHPQEHAREKLAALFWGDSTDASARHSLNVALNKLRKILGTDFVLTDRSTVQRNPAFPLTVDAHEFSALAQRILAPRGDNSAIENQQSKIENYPGDLLADFYDDWILPEREHYRDLYLDSLLALAQQSGADSDYAQAIAYAQRALDIDPANERAHQQLMFCYIATGERQKALDQYERCVNALQAELGVAEPSPETVALVEWIRQTAAASSDTVRLTNLPLPFTSFIGRTWELHDYKDRLLRSRFLTLTGAGGSGKTRFAIQAGIQALDSFRDGVWWIDLAPLTDPARLTETVNRALGFLSGLHENPTERLLDALRNEQRLLIFDNCEHLLDACAHLIQALLQTCPGIKVLATSREPLNLTGEVVYVVPTLTVPNPKRPADPDALLTYEAVRLFVERAQAVNAQFTLNPDNAAAVAEICARLDGIPLAIELAAARTHSLTASEIAARLDDRFALLTRGARTALPRQQTLHALIEWSYNLLNDRERTLFEQLAIFAGGFTLEAAEYVCEPESNVLDVLTRLVEKSLVIRTTVGETTRYSMLETIREFAHAKLKAGPDYARISDRQLNYFFDLAVQFHDEMHDSFPWSWFDRFLPEVENMQVAVMRTLEGDYLPGYARAKSLDRGMMMINMLWLMWFHRGANVGATHALKRILDSPDLPAATRLRALALSVFLARSRGDWAQARELAHQMRDKALEAGDRALYARSFEQIGLSERDNLNLETARTNFVEGRAVFLELDSTIDVYRADMFIAETSLLMGDVAEAKAILERSLVQFRAVDDKGHIAWCLEWLANIARLEGRLAEAGEAYRSTLAYKTAIKDKHALTFSLDALAQVAAGQEQPERAVQLWAAASKLRQEVSARSPALVDMYESLLPQTRTQLGQERFERAWQIGEALTLEQAIALAAQP